MGHIYKNVNKYFTILLYILGILLGTGWNPGEYAYILKEYLDREGTREKECNAWLAHGEVELERGEEYASNIFNALFDDHTPYPFNSNLRNHGYITNIDKGACVEVSVLADADGIHPLGRHTLPQHLDILVSNTAKIEELAVRVAIEVDPQKVSRPSCSTP